LGALAIKLLFPILLARVAALKPAFGSGQIKSVLGCATTHNEKTNASAFGPEKKASDFQINTAIAQQNAGCDESLICF